MKQSIPPIFRKVVKWQDLRFYQKTDVLYQMTVVFCDRFLPKHGDRTVDQMIQAARSGKQNIVEGSEDGKTSTEMELKLLNVARSSIGELRQDYEDYLKSHQLPVWMPHNDCFQSMQDFTRVHNQLADYEPYFLQWSDETMANYGLTLCYQVDTMMNKYLESLATQFVTEGGIKERMHKARTGYRQQQDEQFQSLSQEVVVLRQQLDTLRQELEQCSSALQQSHAETESWQAAYNDLKERALAAYNRQQEEIKALKQKLNLL